MSANTRALVFALSHVRTSDMHITEVYFEVAEQNEEDRELIESLDTLPGEYPV